VSTAAATPAAVAAVAVTVAVAVADAAANIATADAEVFAPAPPAAIFVVYLQHHSPVEPLGSCRLLL